MRMIIFGSSYWMGSGGGCVASYSYSEPCWEAQIREDASTTSSSHGCGYWDWDGGMDYLLRYQRVLESYTPL